MNTQTVVQFPYSFTMPLDNTKEVEIVFRLKEKDAPVDWGAELLSIFEPARAQARRYSAKEVKRDIDRAVKAIRTHA